MVGIVCFVYQYAEQCIDLQLDTNQSYGYSSTIEYCVSVRFCANCEIYFLAGILC